jgi:para-nitrobenzyl esterase
MRFLLYLILILCSFGIKAFADAPVVHTQNGDVLGVLQGSVESFKALPFAAPPVGDLRWKPSQDPANWLGVRDGSKFSSPCPQSQKTSSGTVIVGIEDCLYLNVFRPQGAQGLSVIVFIHGGHNAIGSAGDSANGVAAYDGAELAQNGNVVVVTINYRLGALGFIAHSKLSKEGGGSGNYGYMDQIQALKWVSRNIAAFGGDPNNVTLFGQSSGGGAVSVLMASPLSGGLFHRAIIHSGQFRTHHDLHSAEELGAFLSQQLSCQSAPDELQCMRNKSASEIVLAMPGGHPGGGSVSGPTNFLPVVDRRVLPDFPLEIIRNGKHHHVPLLIGNAADETSWIYEKDSKSIVTEQDYFNKVTTDYGTMMARDLLNLYPSSDYPSPRQGYNAPSPRQAYNAISADHWFVCPTQRLAQAASASQSEFVGRFLYTHVLSGPWGVSYGASHGFDLAFVFGTFGVCPMTTPTPDELTLKDKFQKTWTDFARSGNPGNFWNRYEPAQDNYVIFDTPTSSGTGLRTKQCDYWNSVPDVPEAANAGKPSVVNEGALLPPELSLGDKR